jgi:hypothetical protein
MLGLIGLVVLLETAGIHAQRWGWGRPRTPNAGACFYRNADYRGDYFCAAAGEEYDSMPDGLNDRISSIRLFGNAEVVVYRNPNFGGRSQKFVDDVPNLQQEGWNDTLSSLRVRVSFGKVTRPQAEDIVRRAYLSVLGREPDAGARGYVDRVMRDRWTEQDVARELRKSPEYRNRRPPQ